MRIGIITIQKCDNFGADLQAYAIGAKLRSLGYDAENIDYLFYKHPRHLKSEYEAPVFPLSLANRIKERVAPLVSRLRRMKCNTGSSVRRDLFASFFSENVPCGCEYRSVCDLYRSPPEYDVYITGSDQVWNPRMGSNIKPYFLDFVPPGRRCVSYAASIGVPSISPQVYDTYSRLLARYSAIGVRENTSARIIGGMGLQAPVQTVVDPTLLLTAEEWNRVSRHPDGVKQKAYVAEYNLTHNSEIHSLAIRVANQLGVDVIDVTDGCYGPSEFLWLMGNASAVVCCSFHGTIFSIIYRVPFYSVYSDGAAVKAGQPVCVVEAMKLFNPIKATAAGKITFLVEHGQPVTKGQTIAVIA